MPRKKEEKDIILVVGIIGQRILQQLQSARDVDHRFRFALIYDKKQQLSASQKKTVDQFDIVIPCDLSSSRSIIENLKPYQKYFLASVARTDSNIPTFQKIIPHIPYLRTPTTESLEWSTQKILMRRRFRAYDRKITPNFMVVSDATKKTLRKIEKNVGFPLIAKPSGLEASVLVTISYHAEELEKALRRIFRKLRAAYRDSAGRGEPQVLVERFMEGEMYSIDGYVTSRGKIYFCPLVHIKTGKSIGFDDFFGYLQMTPTKLSRESIRGAEEAATKATHALGIRSSSVHIELIRTEEGWKIIELNPRIGGFRDFLYMKAFGINHPQNDILIRIPQKPVIPRRTRGYAAAMKFFAEKEGIITNLTGVKRVQQLESFIDIIVRKKVGSRATFAKHGGKSVFNIYLFNKDRSKLLADIRRVEQMIKIEVKKNGGRF